MPSLYRNLTKPGSDKPLDEQIQWYTTHAGYRVVERNEFGASLVKPKGFSVVWAIVWFILGIFPLFIYIAYYVAKKEPSVYLSAPGAPAT